MEPPSQEQKHAQGSIRLLREVVEQCLIHTMSLTPMVTVLRSASPERIRGMSGGIKIQYGHPTA